MSKEERYDMLYGECPSGRGPDYWIIYPTGKSYITDEVCKLPGGSEVLRKKALKVLNAMNN